MHIFNILYSKVQRGNHYAILVTVGGLVTPLTQLWKHSRATSKHTAIKKVGKTQEVTIPQGGHALTVTGILWNISQYSFKKKIISFYFPYPIVICIRSELLVSCLAFVNSVIWVKLIVLFTNRKD